MSRSATGLDQAQRRQDRCRDQARIADRLERDEPDPIRESLGNVCRELERETRLARAARSGECQEPGAPQEIARLAQLGVASDEARELGRQVVRPAIERADRRELGPFALDHQLADPLRAEVLEAVLAEPAQRDAGRQLVGHERRRRLGQENLAAVPGRGDPRRAVDVGSDV